MLLDVTETDPADATQETRLLKSGRTAEVFHWKGRVAIPMGQFAIKDRGKGTAFRAWRLRNGDFLLCRLQTFYLIHDNKVVWQGEKDVFAEDVFEDSDGSILLCSIAEGTSGLLRFASRAHFMRNEFENLLPGHAVMCFLRDREGGWWAGTDDAGVFYCSNPRLDIFDVSTGLPSNDVQRLAADGRETIYAGLRPFDICALSHTGGSVKVLPRPPGKGFKELTTLRFDTLTGRLWCGADLSFWENEHWTFSDRTGGLSNSPDNSISAQNIVPDPNGKSWWVDYRLAFASVDRRSGRATQYLHTDERIFSITPDYEGNFWVTSISGLRLWQNGQFEKPPFDHPALRYPLRGLALLPEQAGGGIVIRLRGGGLLIRDKNGLCTHLTRQNGLLSDFFSGLYITSDGVIYACSNAGLNRLTRQSEGVWLITGLTVKHGLPSNQVNDVALLNDELWVATDRGVARFKGKPTPVLMPMPQIESFQVNNSITAFVPNLRLEHDQNNIILRFFAAYFRSGGDILYRYRLLPSDSAFSYSHAHEVNFAALPPGAYHLEAQAQNEDGQWSEPAHWAFEIRPAWWNTAWFRALASASLLLGLWLFYRNRLRAAREEAATREKMRDLQTAALRAQMNPHFIFNCLASIQHFIAENDSAAATRYLSRFARLVRLALHGSLDGTHALADEVEMLENYLSLEQLRFRGKFNFEIRIEPGLDPNDVFLPPMLVQPFVENAIQHGMKNKEKDGQIKVVFSAEGSNLLVAISDNGPGFDPEKKAGGNNSPENEGHKSVGMTLTGNRLELLAGKDQAAPFVRESLLDADGMRVGARVLVRIPLG